MAFYLAFKAGFHRAILRKKLSLNFWGKRDDNFFRLLSPSGNRPLHCEHYSRDKSMVYDGTFIRDLRDV